jgi:hypothetical protein
MEHISNLIDRMQNMCDQMRICAELIERMEFALNHLPLSEEKRNEIETNREELLSAFNVANFLYGNLAVKCENEIAARMAINDKILELLK